MNDQQVLTALRELGTDFHPQPTARARDEVLRRGKRRVRLQRVVVAAAAVVAVAAAGIGATLLRAPSPDGQQVASGLSRADMPAGWTKTPPGNCFRSGFNSPITDNAAEKLARRLPGSLTQVRSGLNVTQVLPTTRGVTAYLSRGDVARGAVTLTPGSFDGTICGHYHKRTVSDAVLIVSKIINTGRGGRKQVAVVHLPEASQSYALVMSNRTDMPDEPPFDMPPFGTQDGGGDVLTTTAPAPRTSDRLPLTTAQLATLTELIAR